MKVTLLNHTSMPERQVAAAAKLCYSPSGVADLMDDLTDAAAAEFVSMLAEVGHESPIEHASFTFGIEEVSRSLLAQITRHRIASFSVQSQRYVKKGSFGYVIPPSIAADAQALELYNKAMASAQEAYDKLSELLSTRRLESAENKSGKDISNAQKSAIEDARFVLPNACHTNLICTMNARSLLNFFSLRCCNRAQWEIRALAEEMLALVRDAAPSLFSKAGPPCVRGACQEGKMSCGKSDDVRANYARLGIGVASDGVVEHKARGGING